jgi:GNAT superfamily N-acetyltransferase
MPRIQDSRIAAAAADVRCLWRTRGPRSALSSVARGVAATVYARDDLEVLVKPLDAIEPIAFSPRLQIGDLDGASLAALAALNRRRCDTRSDRRFERNLQRRYHGFIAHEDGALAGYYWWLDGRADGHEHLERLGLALGPGDVYGFDFYLDEAHRGGGRAMEFLHAVECALRDRGYERLWGYVTEDNRPARWLYSARGYQVARRLRLRRGAMR